MPIAFDTAGMQQIDQSAWQRPDTGEVVTLEYFDLVPDLPVELGELALLRTRMAEHYAADGCLIEAEVVLIDSVPAFYQLIKVPLPNQPTGQVFVASFIVPKATCSAVLRIMAPERGMTGTREAVVAAQVGFDAMYRPHPYSPALRGRLPHHVADDAERDAQFPDHPLSRARAWARHTAATARIDPRFAVLPPFRTAPAPAAQAHAAPEPVAASAPAEPQPVDTVPESVGIPDPPTAPEPAAEAELVLPEPVVLPEPAVLPEPEIEPEPVIEPAPVVLPEPVAEPAPVVLSEPEVLPEPVVLPGPVAETIPDPPPAPLPEPEPVPDQGPAKAGDVLHTVAVGLPIAGYLPLWHDGGQVSYWRMAEPGRVLARLGAGTVARSEIDRGRYREAALLNPDDGTLLLSNRYRDADGNLGADLSTLSPATPQEAYQAVTAQAMSDLWAWVGEAVLGAARRGEFVAVETGGWQVPVTPCVLMMVRTDGRQWHSVIEASPVPVGAAVWRDRQPVQGNTQLLASPATDETLRAAGHLTRFAVEAWALHPFQLGLSFGPNPTVNRPA